MMWILHTAMNKAHERVHSKEGVITRLNEISKFYELAVMQLDGCLKFVQEEADSSLESSDEEVLGDLTEIRDRLEGRLKESDLAISEKDRELTERIENELKLRQALELKERELDSLRANLELQRTKSEGVEELILGNRIDEDRGEEFSELKHSVDQQVWNIKQKLDPEYNVIDERRNQGFDSVKIEHMSSDIDILKETMDMAFGKMQNAIFLSELGPIEQQWRWTIEKDAIAILINGFMGDILENFKAEVRMREKQVSIGFSKHLSELMKEITCLYEELEPLSTSQSNCDCKISLKTKDRSSSEGDICGELNDSTLMVGKVDQMKQFGKVDIEDGDHHYVAKMIKNHESIIQRKNEELNWLKRETLREKGSSNSRREKDPVSLRRMIQDIIVRMENLINWNAKLGETFVEYGDEENEETSSTKRSSNFDMTEQVDSHVDTLEDIWKKINKISISHAGNEELYNKIRMLKKEKEDGDLQTMIVEECYVVFLEGLMCESSIELCAYDLEILIRESMHEDFLKEAINEWHEKIEGDQIGGQIREEIYCVVLSEAVKDFGSTFDFALIECQDAKAEINWLEDHNLKQKLREEISRVCLGEMCKEWNEVIEINDAESLVKEEIHRIAYEETIRDIANTSTRIEGKLKEMKNSESSVHGFSFSNKTFQCLEYSVKEDICMVFLREISKEWKAEIDNYNFESLVREEIYLLIAVEAAKEASTIYGEALAQDHFRILEDVISPDKEHRSPEIGEEEVLVKKQDSLTKQIKVEDLIQSASSEIKEYGVHLELVGLKHEELDKPGIPREFLTEIESTFTSVTSKVMKALEQLALSKALLSELRSSLGIASKDTDKFDDQMSPTVPFVHKTKPSESWLQLEENEEEKIMPSISAFRPVIEFSQAFMDFKCKVEEKLGLNILRYLTNHHSTIFLEE